MIDCETRGNAEQGILVVITDGLERDRKHAGNESPYCGEKEAMARTEEKDIANYVRALHTRQSTHG